MPRSVRSSRASIAPAWPCGTRSSRAAGRVREDEGTDRRPHRLRRRAMNATEHVRAQLSAYLDGALGDAERTAVEGHLAACPDCRARLGELRATASLIRALPDPVPSRRLVPRVGRPPVWVAPLRTLTTLASGLSVFLFLATALLANVGGL